MKAAIILNGCPFKRQITEDIIICADGGYNILPSDIQADYLVGDFDSVTSPYDGVKTITVPRKKNFTDGELAVETAANLSVDFISIYGADGGSPDHILANYGLLLFAHKLGIEAAIKTDMCDVYYFDNDFALNTEPNCRLSLVPFGGDCLVSKSNGVEYPLKNLLLRAENCGLAVSNKTLANKAEFFIEYGGVLVFLFINH